MTMTKVDPECSSYPQSRRKPYFESTFISLICCSGSHGQSVRFGIFGSFAALQKMSLANAGAPRLQFGTF